MAERIRVGDRLPFFLYDTPYSAGNRFRDLLDAQAPLVLVFMANFGHPITRTFASRYADTYTSLHDGGFALVVRSRADKLARSIGPDTLPYPLLCDAAGVLYEHLSIPTSKSTLMSYSLEGWRILREAKKQGYQPVKGAEQQLPLTLILDRDGTVLFCHYGASLTDVPEDCAAIQSLLEEMELTPGLEPEEDELPYEELQTAVAAESRPRSRHGRERPETTDEFRPIRPVRAYPESDLEKHRCLVCLMTPMTTNEKVPAGSKNGRHFCFAVMQGRSSVCPRLPHYGGLGSAHGVGVGLLDMPFVQPGQAHGDTLAAEGHTAFQQRFAAGMERPRPGQGRAQFVDDSGVHTGTDQHLGAVQLVPAGAAARPAGKCPCGSSRHRHSSAPCRCRVPPQRGRRRTDRGKRRCSDAA